MNLTHIITDIKKELSVQSFDPLHDVSHHYETWKNSYEIVNTEDLELNKEVLYIAAWSHDLETYYRNNNNFKILRSIMFKNGLDKSIQAQVIMTIEQHSFSKEQLTLESKVLFDADKLEHISIPRWEYTLQAYKDGLMNEARIKYYEDLQDKLLAKVQERLHFNYTKIKYKERLEEWNLYAKNKGILVNGKVKISSN